MTTRGLLVLLVACGQAPIAPPPAHPVLPVAVPKRPHPHGPWSWMASTSKPWRLAEEASDVVLVAPDRALLRTYAGEISELSLTTGLAVPVPDPVGPTEKIMAIVRQGPRILAFGRAERAPRVWELTLDPVTAHPIALPDPAPEEMKEVSRPTATVSPDGKRILICGVMRPPMVRDAATLAVVRVFRGVKCGRPHFADRDNVVFGDDKHASEGNIATGVVQPVTGIRFAGPGGRTLVEANGKQQVTDAAGKVIYDAPSSNLIGQVKWTPDGRAINLGLAQLAIRPPTGPVEIPLPIDFNHFDVDDRVAIVVQGQTVIAVDLQAGTLQMPDGNVGSIGHIAVRDGTVYALSDRLRMYRAGEPSGVGEVGLNGFDIGSPLAPVITTGSTAVTLWDPATDAKRVLAEVTFGGLVTHNGSTIVFDDFDTLFRSTNGEPATQWVKWHSDASLDAIDVASNRVVWDWQDAYHVVDVDAQTITSFTVPEFGGACSHGNKLRFAPGGGFVIEATGQLHLYDGWGTWTAGIEPPVTMLMAWEVVPLTGEVVMAGSEDIAIWSPDTNRLVTWKPPTELMPEQIGISDSGNELAVAYADGSLLWADLRELRSHATPVEVVPVPAGLCTAPPPAMKLQDLLVLDAQAP